MSQFIIFLLVVPVYIFSVFAVYKIIRISTAAALCLSFVIGCSIYVFTADVAVSCIVTSLLCGILFLFAVLFSRIGISNYIKTGNRQIIVVFAENDNVVFSDGRRLYKASCTGEHGFRVGNVQNVSFDLFG